MKNLLKPVTIGKGPQGRITKVVSKRGGMLTGRGIRTQVALALANQRPSQARIITTGWKYPETPGRPILIPTRPGLLADISHRLNLILNIKKD